MRQTALFGGVAIVVTLLFIFIILPGFIRVVNTFLDTNPFEEVDRIPPQIPRISPPAEATNQKELTITGYGEAQSEMVAILNGLEYKREKADDDGNFTMTINLEEGENTFAVYSVDAAGNESATTKNYIIILDTEDPTIQIEYPGEGEEISTRANQNLEIRGNTEPNSRIYVNDRLTYPNSEGDFSYTLLLSEGSNEINIRVEDQAGNITEITRTIRFSL